MQIAVCDDEKVFRDKLKKILIDYKTEKRVLIDIFEFESGEQLLNSADMFDIVFLDYQMPGPDGMETARAMRARNLTCSIIFVTNFPQFVIEAFEVSAFRFMIKPIEATDVRKALDKYISQQKLLYPLIIIENGEQRRIAAQEIIYIEGDGKYCMVRTTKESLHCSKTVSRVYELLPQHCFYRIHKSYIVNMYCVDSLFENEVTLTNGEKATVARNHIAEFKRVYREFVKNHYVRF